VTDISLDTVLRVQRRFDWPLDRVYDAWSRPEAWKHWFCVPGEGYSGKMTAFDLEPGGGYRAEMRNPSDETVVQAGIFQDVRPGERLVFTHVWETSVFGEDVDYDETLVAVDFDAAGEGTTVTVTHLGFPNEAVRDEHIWGWEGCLEALDRFLSRKTSRHG
jgi:uncharacterized protein YndB with AHSA1/START domain